MYTNGPINGCLSPRKRRGLIVTLKDEMILTIALRDIEEIRKIHRLGYEMCKTFSVVTSCFDRSQAESKLVSILFSFPYRYHQQNEEGFPITSSFSQ